MFTLWYGKSIDVILAERKDDLTTRPNEFIVDQKQHADRYEKLLTKILCLARKEGCDNANTRNCYCKGLRQIFRFYSMPMYLHNGSPINATTPKIDDFPLKPEHIRKIFHVAQDVRSKLWVSLGNDAEWRIHEKKPKTSPIMTYFLNDLWK
jgi:hypothetical protein